MDQAELQGAGLPRDFSHTPHDLPDLASINILPEEILTNIFAIASASTFCSFGRDQNDPLLVMSAVCKNWYQAATGTKSLWSHIDVNVYLDAENRWNLHIPNITLLWLRRAEGAPLHIHFDRCSGRRYFTASEFNETFQPYAAYISALTFAERHTEEIVCDLLNICSRYAVPGTLKKLVIHGLYFQDDTAGERLTWPTFFLRGLTSLHLGPLYQAMWPTLGEFATILTHSPLLRTLRLERFQVAPSREPDPPSIFLPSLEILDLEYVEESTLVQLLPMLSVGSCGLHARLEFDDEPKTLVAVQAFLKRSNVHSVSLLCGMASIAKDFSILPNLRTLYLDISQDCIAQLGLLLPLTREGHLIPRCPPIQHLGLIEGRLGKSAQETIQRIIEANETTTISFIFCALWDTSAYLVWSKVNDPWGKGFYDGLMQRVEEVTVKFALRGMGWCPFEERRN